MASFTVEPLAAILLGSAILWIFHIKFAEWQLPVEWSIQKDNPQGQMQISYCPFSETHVTYFTSTLPLENAFLTETFLTFGL